MRVARLWSHLEDGVPVLDSALGRTDEAESKEPLLRFLEGGSAVLGAPGLAEDWLDPHHPLVVPVGFRTDGAWLWSIELAFYLRAHGIVPEPQFVAHMAALGFVAPPASEADLTAAEALLRGAES